MQQEQAIAVSLGPMAQCHVVSIPTEINVTPDQGQGPFD